MENGYNDTPVISVILPVYNGGPYLEDSVRSVLMQDLKDFELLILDDRSTDESLQYLEKIDDKRVTLFKNDVNKGLFYNLNFLIGKSSSPLIKLWSQDDIMYSNCLSGFAAFHKQYPGIGFSYSQRDIINEYGKVKDMVFNDQTPAIVSPELHAKIAYLTGSIAGNISNVCISRKVLNVVGPFKEHMKMSADFDMWVRIARTYDTGHIKDRLIKLRDHPAQLSRKESLYINNLREDLEVYRYLNSYVSPDIRAEGKKVLRKGKFIFYYSLMVQTLLKGKFRTAFSLFRELSRFDNFITLTALFLSAKLKKTGSIAFTNV